LINAIVSRAARAGSCGEEARAAHANLRRGVERDARGVKCCFRHARAALRDIPRRAAARGALAFHRHAGRNVYREPINGKGLH